MFLGGVLILIYNMKEKTNETGWVPSDESKKPFYISSLFTLRLNL